MDYKLDENELDEMTQLQTQDIILVAFEYDKEGRYNMVFGDQYEDLDFTSSLRKSKRFDIPERGKSLKALRICYQ